MKVFILFIILLFYCAFASASELSNYEKIKCVIHIHTDISSGQRTLESYVKEAREKGIGAIVVTDEDWRRWEYGLPPFRRLIKKTVQRKSVMTFGIKRYLDLIKDLNEKYSDVVVIEGIQTNPFYYWSGNFLTNTLTLNNRNKDMLVLGFNNADDYNNMPLVTTHKSKYDAYQGDKFTMPYQDLIDYVARKDGLIFWSHPEIEENTVLDRVRLITVPYHGDLVGTYAYTGFAIFWEGYKKVGRPLGIWDRVLSEYCQGKRNTSIWAIGELEEEGLDRVNLKDVVNVVYVKKLDRQQILNALKKGRFYAALNLFDRVPLVLDEFTVSDESGSNFATMGEEVSFAGDPVIKIKITHEQPSDMSIVVKLIRNNKVIEEFKGESKIDIRYIDEGLPSGNKYYYRIDVVDGSSSQLIANPIFFRKIIKR
ncbi:MAG: PHP domain-containing protein [Candidatus Omnitrophota bacterium]